MTRMNEKKWEEVLGELVGKTYDIYEFSDEVISMCDTEDVIYIGDFEKRAFHSTEFVGVYEENGRNNHLLLEVIRDTENETIEIIDGWVKK